MKGKAAKRYKGDDPATRAIWELWDKVADIEKVLVMIPTDYTPNSEVIEIPERDERGQVYSVSAYPAEYVEKAFRDAIFSYKKGSHES